GLLRDEHDTDGRGSFSAVERSTSDRFLGPDEKMVDESRFFVWHGCGCLNKLFQSHSVIWAHPDHTHRNPRRVNSTDYRQPDVYEGLLAFQPQLDFHEIPCSQVIRGNELMSIL